VNGPVVRVGVLGCGTVGSALIDLIHAQRDAVASRTGLVLEVTRVAVRDLERARAVALPPGAMTTDAAGLVVDPEVDVVVEVIGGIEPARTLVRTALAEGKPVVTANKALLAAHGAELFEAASAAGVDLLFEAAVAGGIPVVRPLRESLLGEPVERVIGIVNGTTNYILTRMTESGADYDEALAEAQALGYAEADPTADVEGLDAAAKIAIVATIAFGAEVTGADVSTEGITGITATDIAFASRRGLVVKLVAVAERLDGPEGAEISARVHPVLVPQHHPLASVRGAGGAPTASAVLGDLVDAAVNLHRGAHASVGKLAPARMRPIEESSSAVYLSLEAADRPGVLASVASVFGGHGVSIASMEQESRSGAGDRDPGRALLEFVTHVARERDVRATIDDLRQLDAVHRVGSVIRVLEAEDR
jgi:homoserine dehydrogenase